MSSNNKKQIRICYFGIYEGVSPRDKVYLDGLKDRGVVVISCVDNSTGLIKFFRLARKLYALRGQYDILWVGYLSTMVVPLAWLISRKKIIFNALDSWYDRAILDRGMHSRFSPKAILIRCADFLAFHLSESVLVESQCQKKFIAKSFLVRASKLKVIFTGVDESIFHPDTAISKAEDFTVVFRGMFLPATGVEIVLECAKLFKNEGIKFIIIGWGQPIQKSVEEMIKREDLSNVKLITHFLPPDELRNIMLSANVMLGQFGDHGRLERTIQNKTGEAMALGMPYITRDSPSSREVLKDQVNCLFVSKADARSLKNAILILKSDENLQISLGKGAYLTFKEKLQKNVLAEEVLGVLYSL